MRQVLTRIARIWVFALLVTLPGLGLAGPTDVALVVGNADYRALPGLSTARSDAEDIAAGLRGLGFEVTLLTDAGAGALEAGLDSFAAQARSAETVVFYFAGHVVQTDGINRLVPVDATLDRIDAAQGAGLALNEVGARLGGGAGQVVILLEAGRALGLPAGLPDRGLAPYEAEPGSFVAFAGQPGVAVPEPAAGSRNSRFTGAMLARMAVPEQGLSDLMVAVRSDVDAATAGQQVPWDQSQLRAKVVLRSNGAASPLPVFEFVDTGAVLLPETVTAAVVSPGVIRPVADSAVARLAAVPGAVRTVVAGAAAAPQTGHVTGVKAETRLTGVSPGDAATTPAPADAKDLHRALQTELKRVGCYTKGIDGDWGRGSQAALERFLAARKVAKPAVPDVAALDLLRDAPEKTCKPQKVAQPAVKKPKPAGSSGTKKPAATKPAAAKPAVVAAPTKPAVKCKFLVVAVVCN